MNQNESEQMSVDAGATPASASENKITPEQVQALENERSSQGKVLTIPHGRGTLTSNTYRQTIGTKSGNTYQWDYLVSAVYKGNVRVLEIRTTWYATASLRNNASINLGISKSGGSVGFGSSWQTARTPTKYWSNTNGAKRADYRSNIVVAPAIDYRTNSISITNTASVLLEGDPKTYSISSGA